MAIGKKAVFFTAAAIILLLAVAILLAMQASYKKSDRTVIESRTSTMNDFAKNVKGDIQRGLYITSFRAIMSLEEHASKGNKVSNTEQAFKQALVDGKIGNQTLSLMKDSTFKDWTEGIQVKAAEINIIANISADSISIKQRDSWTIKIDSNITINITDTLNTAKWKINHTATAEISIIGLEDPTFILNTQGKISRTINITPYEGNYVNGQDTSNLKKHIDGLYYTNGTGPSFLMRFENNFSNSTFGIESMVSIPQLEQQGLQQYQRSTVDYKYFGNLTTEGLYKVNNTYEQWLRLDNGSLDKYEAREIAVT